MKRKKGSRTILLSIKGFSPEPHHTDLGIKPKIVANISLCSTRCSWKGVLLKLEDSSPNYHENRWKLFVKISNTLSERGKWHENGADAYCGEYSSIDRAIGSLRRLGISVT